MVVITSVAGFDNLFALLGEPAAAWLRGLGYVVASERLAGRGQELGVDERPLVAAGADDRAVLDALLAWRAAHPHTGS